MDDIWFERIEQYLNGEMSPDEKQRFESAMATDPEIKSAFDVYKAVETGIRNKQKQDVKIASLKNILEQAHVEYKRDIEIKSLDPRVVPLWRRDSFKKIAAVAACVLLAVMSYFTFFYEPKNPHTFASNYIQQNLAHINQKMSGAQDSLKQGIAAYNDENYDKALLFFEGIVKSDPANTDAIEYAGYAYLLTKNYARAMERFDDLTRVGGRFNRGMFLKAVTLLQRQGEGDTTLAKQLLEQVVKEKSGGSKEAEEWLKEFHDNG